jgi:hypothetical protein
VAERYPSAAALANDLDRFLRGEGVAARRLTLWDQAARLVRHRQLDVNWGAWFYREWRDGSGWERYTIKADNTIKANGLR